MKREIRINNFTKNASDIKREVYLNSEIVTFQKEGSFYYSIFIGRSSRPSYYNTCVNGQAREEKLLGIKEIIRKDHEKRTQYFEGKKKQIETIQEGTILYSDWGYEQTNINFFLVISRNKSTVTLQEIGKHKEFYKQDQGTCTPNKESKIGEPFKRRITKYATVKINEAYDASKYNGEKLHWSSYY